MHWKLEGCTASAGDAGIAVRPVQYNDPPLDEQECAYCGHAEYQGERARSTPLKCLHQPPPEGLPDDGLVNHKGWCDYHTCLDRWR